MGITTKLTSAQEAVARIAYRSADFLYVIESTKTALTADSLKAVRNLQENETLNASGYRPIVQNLKAHADPFIYVADASSHPITAERPHLDAVVAASDSLFFATPHLYTLANTPVVVHIALGSTETFDFAAVRDTGFLILFSGNNAADASASIADTIRTAAQAHKLALKLNTGVLHFYTPVSKGAYALEDVALLPTKDEMDWARDAFGESFKIRGSTPIQTTSQRSAKIQSAVAAIKELGISPFDFNGPADASTVLLSFGSSAGLLNSAATDSKLATLSVRVLRPWLFDELIQVLPESVKRLVVLEQVSALPKKWEQLYLDVLVELKSRNSAIELLSAQYALSAETDAVKLIASLLQELKKPIPSASDLRFVYGSVKEESLVPTPPLIEETYHKLLQRVFKARLRVANDSSLASAKSIPAQLVISPQFALGSVLEYEKNREHFCSRIGKLLKGGAITNNETLEALSNWLVSVNNEDSTLDPTLVIEALKKDSAPSVQELLSESHYFVKKSHWIIGSDAWAYDLGNSAVHQALCDEANVNLLVIDTQPYSTRNDVLQRKKDIGLYAMNFGNAYVASVAIYSSYTQVLAALLEADKFKGPSVVLGYLPYFTSEDDAITVMKETKCAVDAGYWPLYRWTPALKDGEYSDFQLDSERVRDELKKFLDRDNYLTQLTLREPRLAKTLTESFGAKVREQQKLDARAALNRLLEGLSGPQLTILYASDGGVSEGVAKRLNGRATARGSKSKVMAMDDFPLSELEKEENVVFLVSTAGQGEFPQNGREFWKELKGNVDLSLSKLNFAVFGFGDYDYWPRKEDKIYYNRPSKQLDARLAELGAHPLISLGLGNDQDPDGWATAYNVWEPELWASLGLDNVDVDINEPAPVTAEDIKRTSNYLRGTIMEGLADTTTGAVSESDSVLVKFHGMYMQDDRDIRDERKKQGLEPAYTFMLRLRMPGGVCSAEQYIALDDISTKWGNKTLKITTRQTFQSHGVLKGNLRSSIRAIVKVMLTTLGASGDVCRNVTAACIPTNTKLHKQIYDVAKEASEGLLPSTSAYHEIWIEDPETVEKRKVAGEAVQDVEPLYGPTYLPRKFKVGIAVPPHNDIDVYINDVGLVAITSEDGDILEGFNVYIGGGLGTTHNNKKTYPRLGDLAGYVPVAKTLDILKAILIVQRDNGDRENRKHARIKYTVDTMTFEKFVAETERNAGFKFEPARPQQPFVDNTDDFGGWAKTDLGTYSRTIFIENGRIEDTAQLQFKTGMRELAEKLLDTGSKAEFRMTANQHMILHNVSESELPWVNAHLAKYKLDNTAFTGLRLSSAACVALPTCGYAMAESERYLPKLITKVEDIINEAGLTKDSITMRMTGCGNGCSRPWVAEIACVGKAPNTYNLLLGGGHSGERLNKLYKASVQEKEILDLLRPIIKRYALERQDNEPFGDFVIRTGYVTATERNGANGAVHEGISADAA
ncbi:sulfite reductase Sir1 [Schizosaccharomyces japonicus yFS275]|uniref:assimilatory sulfite reductase (NADPH) n=1 Tax=Schizosaccharomyces japonicus (strain yFS275 / FY16936) TaxID=402676 RepID=B6K8E8_SCHJY|nr:sulfite reductase Sir1 [Schizosaccharomyces japonicus yFS275]EEB09802.1 sulfite reductase Sir1 [Schizosaccharomyces japonicus yFS275]